MFTTLIVQPIFNLLVLIYAILPGHNFGLSLVIFTVVIRLLMWPMVKKQLHQAKAMKKLQPDIKRIKQASKGDRQKEQTMIMELYKERGINPFATFPTLIVQILILFGLYSGLRRLIDDPHTIISFSYPALHHLGWIGQLSHNIHLFDNTLFGVVNLNRAALNPGGGVYWPAFFIVIGSAAAQYFVSGQLLPKEKDQRTLRQILKASSDGEQADTAEINAAIGRSTRYLIPFMIFIVTIRLPAALGLYWFVGGVAAYVQQAIALREDEEELEAMADKPAKKNVAAIPEAEVISQPKPKKKSPSKAKKATKKRRK